MRSSKVRGGRGVAVGGRGVAVGTTRGAGFWVIGKNICRMVTKPRCCRTTCSSKSRNGFGSGVGVGSSALMLLTIGSVRLTAVISGALFILVSCNKLGLRVTVKSSAYAEPILPFFQIHTNTHEALAGATALMV